MRRHDNNQNTRLPDIQPPQSVNDNGIANRKPCYCRIRKGIELLQGHFLVSFVFEVKRSSAPAVISNNAFEYDDSPVACGLHSRNNLLRIYLVAHKECPLLNPFRFNCA